MKTVQHAGKMEESPLAVDISTVCCGELWVVQVGVVSRLGDWWLRGRVYLAGRLVWSDLGR